MDPSVHLEQHTQLLAPLHITPHRLLQVPGSASTQDVTAPAPPRSAAVPIPRAAGGRPGGEPVPPRAVDDSSLGSYLFRAPSTPRDLTGSPRIPQSAPSSASPMLRAAAWRQLGHTVAWPPPLPSPDVASPLRTTQATAHPLQSLTPPRPLPRQAPSPNPYSPFPAPELPSRAAPPTARPSRAVTQDSMMSVFSGAQVDSGAGQAPAPPLPPLPPPAFYAGVSALANAALLVRWRGRVLAAGPGVDKSALWLAAARHVASNVLHAARQCGAEHRLARHIIARVAPTLHLLQAVGPGEHSAGSGGLVVPTVTAAVAETAAAARSAAFAACLAGVTEQGHEGDTKARRLDSSIHGKCLAAAACVLEVGQGTRAALQQHMRQAGTPAMPARQCALYLGRYMRRCMRLRYRVSDRPSHRPVVHSLGTAISAFAMGLEGVYGPYAVGDLARPFQSRRHDASVWEDALGSVTKALRAATAAAAALGSPMPPLARPTLDPAQRSYSAHRRGSSGSDSSGGMLGSGLGQALDAALAAPKPKPAPKQRGAFMSLLMRFGRRKQPNRPRHAKAQVMRREGLRLPPPFPSRAGREEGVDMAALHTAIEQACARPAPATPSSLRTAVLSQQGQLQPVLARRAAKAAAAHATADVKGFMGHLTAALLRKFRFLAAVHGAREVADVDRAVVALTAVRPTPAVPTTHRHTPAQHPPSAAIAMQLQGPQMRVRGWGPGGSARTMQVVDRHGRHGRSASEAPRPSPALWGAGTSDTSLPSMGVEMAVTSRAGAGADATPPGTAPDTPPRTRRLSAPSSSLPLPEEGSAHLPFAMDRSMPELLGGAGCDSDHDAEEDSDSAPDADGVGLSGGSSGSQTSAGLLGSAVDVLVGSPGRSHAAPAVPFVPLDHVVSMFKYTVEVEVWRCVVAHCHTLLFNLERSVQAPMDERYNGTLRRAMTQWGAAPLVGGEGGRGIALPLEEVGVPPTLIPTPLPHEQPTAAALRAYSGCIDALVRCTLHRSGVGKGQCLAAALRGLNDAGQAVRGGGAGLSADELLPLLAWALVASNLQDIPSHVAFAEEWLPPSQATGEWGYAVTLASTAAHCALLHLEAEGEGGGV